MEWNDQDNEGKTKDTRDDSGGDIAQLEDNEFVRASTNNYEYHNDGKNTIEVEARDNDMSQGEDTSDTPSPSEEETQVNTEEPNLIRSRRDRKSSSPYKPYFEGK